MKSILKFLSLYLIIIFAIVALYVSVTSDIKKQVRTTKNEIAGVQYLKSIYKVAIDAAIYQGYLELNESVEKIQISQGMLLSSIEDLYNLQKKYPKFKNDEFNKQLENIKNSNLDAKTNYEFFESINHENYRIGDISNLLFEKDREAYFLTSLVTHYMPEYLISILINHNIAEEFSATGSLTDYKAHQYTEHNKLIYLSSDEIYNIIKLLAEYDETKELTALIETIIKKIELAPQDENLFFSKNEKHISVDEYLNWSHDILELSYKLNDEHIFVLDSILKQRVINLEYQLTNFKIGLIFILTLLSTIFYFFYRSYMENIAKDIEIKKINLMLDDFVVFSKTDTNGRITYISSALEKLCGYSLDEIKGKTFNIINNLDTDRNIFKGLWETITQGKVWTGELNNIAKDGSNYWIASTITADLDSNGKIIGYISYSTNITDVKNLEREKIKTQKALEFKSQFLSNMSHEIRTPLNSIVSLAKLILKTNLDEKQKYMLDKVNSASTILLGVINDILDISKIESGNMQIEKESINLKKCVNNVYDMLLIKAQENGISMNIQYENISENNYIGDSLRISQVLTNLINNSIKFTEDGSVNINVKDIGNDIIRFEVKDTGIGLKSEQMSTLFQEFTQADMSISRKYGGTGLGLSISKNLVEIMGGKIYVTSQYGIGSVFTFEIPLEIDLAYKNGELELANEKYNEDITTKINSLENIKILVAEDNHMNQIVLKMLLEESNIELDFADDGILAVDKSTRNKYNMILMDIQMPNMNGYEATEAIRAIDSDTIIIGLSANAMKEDIDKAIGHGMNDYLTKPIDIEKLYLALNKYLPKT